MVDLSEVVVAVSGCGEVIWTVRVYYRQYCRSRNGEASNPRPNGTLV